MKGKLAAVIFVEDLGGKCGKTDLYEGALKRMWGI